MSRPQNARRRRDPMYRARAAFTLMEMLLVMVIIAFAVATSTPYLVHSMKGNRLRSAARSIVQAARHARTMAILRQTDCSLSFSVGGGNYSIGAGGAAPAAGPSSPPAPAAAVGGGESGSLAGAGALGAFQGTLDRVQIASVDVQGAGERRDGAVGITYERNGRCTPYVVKLLDEDGHSMRIRVDAVGSIKSEDERGTR